MGYDESFLTQTIDIGRALSNTELEIAVSELTKELENRKKIKREALRQELLENLQKALGDILHNGFQLIIENTDRDCHDDYGCVVFDPDENYSITME